jgi:pilus assembly protein TadC
MTGGHLHNNGNILLALILILFLLTLLFLFLLLFLLLLLFVGLSFVGLDTSTVDDAVVHSRSSRPQED